MKMPELMQSLEIKRTSWEDRIRLRVRLVYLFASVLLVSPADAHASLFEFTYTGNMFTDVSRPYTINDQVTAEFIIDLPTILNLPFSSYITSLQGQLTMSDGIRTLSWPTDSSPEEFFPEFRFSTNSAGIPDSWQVAINSVPGINSIFTYAFGCVFPELGPVCDFTHNIPPGNSPPAAFISNNPGTWAVTQVPEPATPLLLLSGLMGFKLRRANRRQSRDVAPGHLGSSGFDQQKPDG